MLVGFGSTLRSWRSSSRPWWSCSSGWPDGVRLRRVGRWWQRLTRPRPRRCQRRLHRAAADLVLARERATGHAIAGVAADRREQIDLRHGRHRRALSSDQPMLAPAQVAPKLTNIRSTRSGITPQWRPNWRTNRRSGRQSPGSAMDFGIELHPCQASGTTSSPARPTMSRRAATCSVKAIRPVWVSRTEVRGRLPMKLLLTST